MSIRSARLSVLAGLFIAGVAASPLLAQGELPPPSSGRLPIPTLVTSGQGEAKAAPDRAAVTINVQSRGATAAAAATENAQRTRAVLTALGALGLPKEQLSTQGYSVYPEMAYDKTGGSPRVAAYVVTNTIRAETHQISQAGAILDAALGAGANMINGLSFYSANIDAPRREAIALAVASARADADAMAHAAGGSLGTLVELSTQGPTAPPRPMYDMALRKSSAMETPINAGEQTISVFVTARWQFVPPR
jgi:uncharacterized protein YggE